MSANIYPLQPIAALIAGILILIRPRLLNYIVAIYLILIGIIGLAHYVYRFNLSVRKGGLNGKIREKGTGNC